MAPTRKITPPYYRREWTHAFAPIARLEDVSALANGGLSVVSNTTVEVLKSTNPGTS